VNGSLNIGRKELGNDAFLRYLFDKGCVCQPISMSFHNVETPKRFGIRRIPKHSLAGVRDTELKSVKKTDANSKRLQAV
jgi:hypothetical protein